MFDFGHFCLFGNVSSKYNIAPLGNCELHYEISLYELCTGTQPFLSERTFSVHMFMFLKIMFKICVMCINKISLCNNILYLQTHYTCRGNRTSVPPVVAALGCSGGSDVTVAAAAAAAAAAWGPAWGPMRARAPVRRGRLVSTS
jgi:hypothetical protein